MIRNPERRDFMNYEQLGQRRSRRRLLRWILLLGIFLVLAIGGAAFYVYGQLQPVEAQNESKNVIIPSGASVREIGDLLEESGLIRNADLFSLYVRYKGVASQLKAGEYRFTPGQSNDQIIAAMVEGNVVVNNARFTIPEGWNVEQIADHLAREGFVDKEVFLREVNTGSFPEFPFVAKIPQNEQRKYRLEGYLFPETYEVKQGASEREIIGMMLAQFQKVWQEEWTEKVAAKNLTIDQAVVLASIVEREVVVDKERPIVAGVYYNRLRDDWPLQADATVQFVLGKQKERLTYEDLKVESPYNTYTNAGLPPGPIANPGRASLAAVVNPQEHDYYFYVTKKDGTFEHYFAKTLEEHNRNDAKSRQNGGQQP